MLAFPCIMALLVVCQWAARARRGCWGWPSGRRPSSWASTQSTTIWTRWCTRSRCAVLPCCALKRLTEVGQLVANSHVPQAGFRPALCAAERLRTIWILAPHIAAWRHGSLRAAIPRLGLGKTVEPQCRAGALQISWAALEFPLSNVS